MFECPRCKVNVIAAKVGGNEILVDAAPHPDGNVGLLSKGYLGKILDDGELADFRKSFPVYRKHECAETTLVIESTAAKLEETIGYLRRVMVGDAETLTLKGKPSTINVQFRLAQE